MSLDVGVPQAATRPSARNWALLGCCVAGLGVSIYLTLTHYTKVVALVCSNNGAINCEKVTTSPQSEVSSESLSPCSDLLFFALSMLVLALPEDLPAPRAEHRASPTRILGRRNRIRALPPLLRAFHHPRDLPVVLECAHLDVRHLLPGYQRVARGRRVRRVRPDLPELDDSRAWRLFDQHLDEALVAGESDDLVVL